MKYIAQAIIDDEKNFLIGRISDEQFTKAMLSKAGRYFDVSLDFIYFGYSTYENNIIINQEGPELWGTSEDEIYDTLNEAQHAFFKDLFR